MRPDLLKQLICILVFPIWIQASFLSLLGKNRTDNKRFCVFCQMLNIRFRFRLLTSTNNEDLVGMIREHCVLVTPNDLCHKLMDEYGEHIVSTLKVLVENHSDVCEQFVLGCTNDKSAINQLWSLQLPKKAEVETQQKISQESKKYQVLHLTDPHIDFEYAEGSEADCQTDETLGLIPLCCRKGDITSPTEMKMPSGKWGMPMHCDPPYRLFESALKYIKENLKNIDYIILTGDYEVHTVWDGNYTRAVDRLLNTTGTIQSFFPNTSLFVTIGNHEGDPSDSFLFFPSVKSALLTNSSTAARDEVYKALQGLMKPHLSRNSSLEVLRTGSYSVQPYNGLKLIFINNNYCSDLNFLAYTDLVDPDGVLRWLIEELDTSEKNQEKVHIIGHIPPGDTCLKGWANMFLKIVQRFSDIIGGQFYGHTHHDEFSVFLEGKEPFGSAFVSPSFSTFPGQNPAFRTYTMSERFVIEDIQTYSADIIRANLLGTEPMWFQEYRFKEFYDLPDLSISTLHNLTKKLSNPLYFERYEYLYWKNWRKMCSTASCRNRLRNDLLLNIKSK